jgi:hypothetical protein
LLKTGKAKIMPELQAVIICERMGWTFNEYEAQPIWFLELLQAKLNEDGKHQNRKK